MTQGEVKTSVRPQEKVQVQGREAAGWKGQGRDRGSKEGKWRDEENPRTSQVLSSAEYLTESEGMQKVARYLMHRHIGASTGSSVMAGSRGWRSQHGDYNHSGNRG